ncbi:hypothetical protein LTS17_006918 [Exophiala oligosperma]
MSLTERQKRLLQTGDYSDFILTVEGREFKIHRNIVCSQSPMLHRLCNGSSEEEHGGRGTLAEENADIFEKVLEYLYTGEYDLSTENLEPIVDQDNEVLVDYEGMPEVDTTEPAKNKMETLRRQSEQLMVHTEVYLLAKYLDISELIQLATNKFIATVKENFRADAFVEPFSRVFEHGADGDSGLRAQILLLCLENSQHNAQDTELAKLLLHHEPITWKMLLLQARKHTSLVDEIMEGQRALEKQHTQTQQKSIEMLSQKFETQRIHEKNVQTLQNTIETLNQKVEDIEKHWDDMCKLLQKYDECRNCGNEFGSYIKKDEVRKMRFLNLLFIVENLGETTSGKIAWYALGDFVNHASFYVLEIKEAQEGVRVDSGGLAMSTLR